MRGAGPQADNRIVNASRVRAPPARAVSSSRRVGSLTRCSVVGAAASLTGVACTNRATDGRAATFGSAGAASRREYSATSQPSVMAASVSEFDPGSGTTLAACLTHASRAGSPFGAAQRRTGEERVIDLPASGGQPRETGAVTACVRPPVGGSGKAFRGARGGGCVRLASRRGDGPPRRRSVAGLRGRPATGGLRHGPHTYGWQQRGIFGNGRKPDRATPRAG